MPDTAPGASSVIEEQLDYGEDSWEELQEQPVSEEVALLGSGEEELPQQPDSEGAEQPDFGGEGLPEEPMQQDIAAHMDLPAAVAEDPAGQLVTRVRAIYHGLRRDRDELRGIDRSLWQLTLEQQRWVEREAAMDVLGITRVACHLGGYANGMSEDLTVAARRAKEADQHMLQNADTDLEAEAARAAAAREAAAREAAAREAAAAEALAKEAAAKARAAEGNRAVEPAANQEAPAAVGFDWSRVKLPLEFVPPQRGSSSSGKGNDGEHTQERSGSRGRSPNADNRERKPKRSRSRSKGRGKDDNQDRGGRSSSKYDMDGPPKPADVPEYELPPLGFTRNNCRVGKDGYGLAGVMDYQGTWFPVAAHDPAHNPEKNPKLNDTCPICFLRTAYKQDRLAYRSNTRRR
jgi:hypothetical protein